MNKRWPIRAVPIEFRSVMPGCNGLQRDCWSPCPMVECESAPRPPEYAIGKPIGSGSFDDSCQCDGVPREIEGYGTDVFFAECQRFIPEKSKSLTSSILRSTPCTARTPSHRSTRLSQSSNGKMEDRLLGRKSNHEQPSCTRDLERTPTALAAFMHGAERKAGFHLCCPKKSQIAS